MLFIIIIFFPACIYLSIQDYRKKVVPLWQLLFLIAIAIISVLLFHYCSLEAAVLGGCVGLFLIIVSKLTATIGMGDGLLVIATGIILGLRLCLYMIFIAFIMAICCFGILLIVRRLSTKSIPFIPFISMSFFIVLLFIS